MSAKELFSTPLFSDANLQGYYRFESNGNDSKNSNNLTLTGSPTYSAGKFNNGIVTVSGKHGTVNAFEYVTSFTWMMWVNIRVGAAFDQAAVGKNKADLSVARKISFSNGGSPTTQFWTPAIGITGLSAGGAVAGETITSGVTNFIAGIYDATNTVCKIWVNGNKYQTTNTGTPTASPDVFNVGRASAADSTFDGNIDDLAIFNRALTDVEILKYFNGDWTKSSLFLYNLI